MSEDDTRAALDALRAKRWHGRSYIGGIREGATFGEIASLIGTYGTRVRYAALTGKLPYYDEGRHHYVPMDDAVRYVIATLAAQEATDAHD